MADALSTLSANTQGASVKKGVESSIQSWVGAATNFAQVSNIQPFHVAYNSGSMVPNTADFASGNVEAAGVSNVEGRLFREGGFPGSHFCPEYVNGGRLAFCTTDNQGKQRLYDTGMDQLAASNLVRQNYTKEDIKNLEGSSSPSQMQSTNNLDSYIYKSATTNFKLNPID